jgi:hypothetical protein
MPDRSAEAAAAYKVISDRILPLVNEIFDFVFELQKKIRDRHFMLDTNKFLCDGSHNI